jgi:hypothetical protein
VVVQGFFPSKKTLIVRTSVLVMVFLVGNVRTSVLVMVFLVGNVRTSVVVMVFIVGNAVHHLTQ